MSTLEGLFYVSQVPFDEVNMDCTEYYQAGYKVYKYKEKYLRNIPIWSSLYLKCRKRLYKT